ncbi:SDR family oxidoreductase [Rhodococcus sp. NCIMB 12038]|jgi:NAD(P)-dependent dehydrogenase (short-subunit alcohol dehydrogenase family)|uniref:SDR family oxidoreductase n=1 Tax=Rhodococcus sp. NCIMB 12038 TaxID=933800 RepID=UPI000B3CC866|nr:SDR family oxidoreductase [Rhodococcus sp. NCIMB 12038]OUS88584.1 short-chain dehydrogenase/reductase [Rhodococcus sp. NCIMB 12038]
MSKTWLITGAGRGFGREFAIAALGRGDRVAATARNTEALKDLVDIYGDAIIPLSLDVTDREAVGAAVATAHERLGSLDVVVNNAGYGLFGTVEEISEQQLRDQLEVNLFGVLHVTQAVLPILREQGAGHVVQISTVGGIAAFPTLGGYHASKWALEGLSESLAQEVAQFGISVTLIEPGGFSTDWAGSSAVHAEPLPHYDALRAAFVEQQKNTPPEFTGDPTAAGPALLNVVDAEEPPLRVLFGLMPTQVVPSLYQQRLDTWKAWEPVSLDANGHSSS